MCTASRLERQFCHIVPVSRAYPPPIFLGKLMLLVGQFQRGRNLPRDIPMFGGAQKTWPRMMHACQMSTHVVITWNPIIRAEFGQNRSAPSISLSQALRMQLHLKHVLLERFWLQLHFSWKHSSERRGGGGTPQEGENVSPITCLWLTTNGEFLFFGYRLATDRTFLKLWKQNSVSEVRTDLTQNSLPLSAWSTHRPHNLMKKAQECLYLCVLTGANCLC